MSQYVGSRPYTIGGAYSMFRNAASVRRGIQGLGDSGGCSPGDYTCFQSIGDYINPSGLFSNPTLLIGAAAVFLLLYRK